MSLKEQLEKQLQISIKNEILFIQAFTHKSLSKGDESILNNERLEFLGDAVLGVVTAHLLYQFFPHEDEGFLSRKRASLVNESTLSQVASFLNLSVHLKAHHSQSLEEFKVNPRITSSLFEAVIGAIYLDSGFAFAQQWIEDVLKRSGVLSLDQNEYDHDYKTRYQELIQSKYKITPVYEMLESSGPDHLRQFTVTVSVDGVVVAQGTGTSKKVAAQNAAQKALEIEEQNG